MLFKNFKIYNNELCPCGSGIIYAECCKNRVDKIITQSKKPPNIQAVEKLRKAKFRCCLHPETEKCAKHIKEAHALQNGKIISQLAEDGHVYILNTNKAPIIIPIENESPEIMTLIDKVGVNRATTATCFCDYHDDVVFAPIEKGAANFKKDNDEQKFLYAYKAFIFEYYKKLVEHKVFINEIKSKPSMLKSPFFISQYRATSLTLNEMEEVKSFFDKCLINQNYSDLETCVLELPEKINIANYACIAIDFDVNGCKIKHTKKNYINRLFLTIFPEETKSYILMSCLKKDLCIYKSLFEQFNNLNPNKIKYYLDLILPLYSENIVLSPRLWEHWSEEQQLAYTFYANRHSTQFNIYKKMLSMGMHNLRKQENGFEDGNRGKIDLFEKV